MTSQRWTATDVPDLRGRTAVVTGANSGIGYHTALVLAQHRASVVLACRDRTRAADAADRIRATVPDADLAVQLLELSSLASVRAAAAQLRTDHEHIDLLINNAGAVRRRYHRTEDGFESTFAGNHLGPFALTGLLLDRLLATPGSRVVTVSSIGHRRGVIDFDDLNMARGYRAATAYFQSKLANLMFTYELQRRLPDTSTIAVAAHPGNAYTNFPRELNPVIRYLAGGHATFLTSWMVQTPQMGALPTLRAATDPAVRGGEYYGPPGRAQFTGYPERVESSARSHDIEAQQRLWRESERLTGVVYPAASARRVAGS
ncbi:MAG TPA: oxidoreductase [Pseudonocardiaceae bacterium]|nr:oxidoreductase [Pseudonocardiaceae bacterium]